MKEDKLKLLSSPTIISDKLDILIDAFVEFYGEEKRSYIENRFSNSLILKFCNTHNLDQIISNIKEDLFKQVFSIPKDEYFYFNPDKIIEALDSKDKFQLTLISDELKDIIFFGDRDPAVIFEKYSNGEYTKFNEFRRRYLELKETLSPYEEIYKSENDREQRIEKKYYNILVEEFSYLFSEEELKKYYDLNLITENISLYLGSSLARNSFAFGEEIEQILNDPNTSIWKIESIKNDRIEFFKKKGFKLGDSLNEPTYEDYLKNPECVEFIKRMNRLFEKIINRKMELNDLKITEVVYGLKDYTECQSIIDRKQYVNKNDSLGPFVYQSPVSCCEMNYTKEGDKFIESCLILINAGVSNIDQTIIHELNHAYEMFTTEVTLKGSVIRSGWDSEKIEFKDEKEKNPTMYRGITRPYELMSEYINDRISDEIKDIMYAKGNYIISSKKEKSSSGYRVVGFLLEEFYLNFKQIIIESRSNDNIQYIYDKLGRENFEELNNIVNQYYELFGFSYSGMIAVDDWYKGTETNNSKIIAELISRKDTVLAKMHEHLKNIDLSK